VAAVPAVTVDLPPVTGFNFSLATNSQYDDANGWSSSLSPLLSFRLNRHLSLDTGLPFYLTVNAEVNKGTKAVPVYVATTAHDVIGDTAVSGHLDADGSWLSYSFTASGAFPTGNSKYNLSANTPTYEINNHFEHSIAMFTPDIEIGEGNSTSLVGKVRKAYIAVGPVAFFQAGTSIDLPHKINLDLEAYEAMPIGNQNVYGTITTKRGKTKTVLQGTGVAEDNGFNNTCSVPLTRHLEASVFYNRSLRQYENTAGFSFTYTARVPEEAPATR
jgi:hypothetical protein